MARGLSKFFKICFAGLTVLFLGIGFVKSVFFPTDISMYEQRTLNKLPAANLGVFLDNSFQSDFDTALGDQISFSTYYKKLYNEGTSLADELFLHIRHNIHGRYVTYRGSQLFNGQLVEKSESLELIKEPMLETARAINSKISALEDCEFYFYYINNDTEINFETGEKRGTYEFLRDNLILPDANCAVYPIDSFEQYRENFYYSDHHWNHKGSYRAYLQLMELLSVEDELLSPCEELSVPGIFYGSKGLTIGSTSYYDRIKAFRFDFPPMEMSMNGQPLPDYGDLEGIISQNLPVVSYAAVYGDDLGCFKVSTNRPEKGNLLIMGDSYDNALIKLIASHFNDTHSVDMRYYYYLTGESFVLEDYLEENNISKILFIGGSEFYHGLPVGTGW